MDIRKITGDYFVSPQITEADVKALSEQGFRTIICNRPDGEAPDQPAFADIATEARALGLTTLHVPISGYAASKDDIAAVQKALTEAPKPILAFCRTGTRSAVLWSLAQADKMPLDDILDATGAAGYDLAPVLQNILGAGAAN
ncbi:TIGR01244 family sulfur transferase [Marimonas sp. MJW-29]|uniref:TIGR01244 family sulfur transferase n=1 Tax=Sulfitobacter sediminis TaxID=3234186 RepID=A0ABV3RRL8_9RHOB